MKIRNIILTLAILLTAIIFGTGKIEAKEKTKIIGNFKYSYQNYSGGIHITEIEPLSEKGISTLNIPSVIDGKKVIKLGYRIDDGSGGTSNIFGMYLCEDHNVIEPEDIIEKVKMIKKIVLPSTLKELTNSVFYKVQDGKTINIPAGVKNNVERLTAISWKKFSVSSGNKKYKVKNGLLLSKNGKKVYGSVLDMEVIKIPNGVKTISGQGYFWGDSLTDMYLPASVDKIGTHGLSARSMVNYHVAKNNKHYADIDGSVYSKKSGRLVAASVKESTYTVPDTVTILKNTCFAGPDVEKFIIPSSVEEIAGFWCPFRENITYVFQDETPPVINKSFALKDITFYVPMGCKEQYKNAVDQSWILENINENANPPAMLGRIE